METVKINIKFRPSAVEGEKGMVYYQVTNGSTVKLICTGYLFNINEWNEARHILFGSKSGSASSVHLRDICERIRSETALLDKVIAALELGGSSVSLEDVNVSARASFVTFMNGEIARLRDIGHIRTSETYLSALRSFMRFTHMTDVMLDDIDQDMMMLYETYLQKQGVTKNTSSFYMRILRAAYNRAVTKGLTKQRKPFTSVYTGVDKTYKRALAFTDVRRIKTVDLGADSMLNFARDMFLFSFYTRGMSFVDMAYLDKKNLQNGVLTYYRRKTGQKLCIKWEKCMQEIIDKYKSTAGNYLLPIIKINNDERKQYINALHLVNSKLKLVAEKAGVNAMLTMYVARHSWASIARSQNVPLAVISEGMGHGSEKTTRIYLASLDNSVIDKANGKILRML